MDRPKDVSKSVPRTEWRFVEVELVRVVLVEQRDARALLPRHDPLRRLQLAEHQLH